MCSNFHPVSSLTHTIYLGPSSYQNHQLVSRSNVRTLFLQMTWNLASETWRLVHHNCSAEIDDLHTFLAYKTNKTLYYTICNTLLKKNEVKYRAHKLTVSPQGYWYRYLLTPQCRILNTSESAKNINKPAQSCLLVIQHNTAYHLPKYVLNKTAKYKLRFPW